MVEVLSQDERRKRADKFYKKHDNPGVRRAYGMGLKATAEDKSPFASGEFQTAWNMGRSVGAAGMKGAAFPEGAEVSHLREDEARGGRAHVGKAHGKRSKRKHR